MSNLSWITTPGTIANFASQLPISYQLLAYDSANNGAPITFSIISGALPQGLTCNSSGVISGTPTSIYSTNSQLRVPYSFTVRANSQNGYVLDGTFTINIVNSITNKISWVTASGSLGTVPNNEYYQIPLQTQTTDNSAVTYTLLSGELPAGMEIAKAGYLQGVPTFTTSTVVDQTKTYSFTVRAQDSSGIVNDRSFSISITDVNGPVIEPAVTSLETYYDGSYFYQQLTVTELSPLVQVQWSIESGALPDGVTLDANTGVISGYIYPIPQANASSISGYNTIVTDPASGAIIYQQEYDHPGDAYDFGNTATQSLSYSFTVQAYDGANYDLQSYTISVQSYNGVYTPILLNTPGAIPTARQDSYYAYKFQGLDFSGDTITYSLANEAGTFDTFVSGTDQGFDYIGFDSFSSGNTSPANLPGLTLDSTTGWLYGKLNSQSTSEQTYTFGIVVSKTISGNTYTSTPEFFNLTVLGDVNNIVNWVTPANLGTIRNGSVSELSVTATSVIGKDLVYSLYDAPGYPAGLPQGLSLLPSGDISGRVSFELFSLDDFATTFDNGALTLDRTYNFTVQAATTDGTSSSLRKFTVVVDLIDQRPYVDLYLTAMPAQNQRAALQSILNDTIIFNPDYIYKPTDPWFGVANNLRMLFLPGLNSTQYVNYANAILNNHWTKTYNFGSIKTAVVFDDNYNVKYEVVYVEIVDPEENSAGQGAPLEINLAGVIANPYIDAIGNNYDVIYPNNSANMISRLVNNVGYYDQSSLPNWMTSDQEGSSGNSFNPPLGYVKAVVLAYTQPGYSKKIAYNLAATGINFKNIDFTIDRYNMDNNYSRYFDTSANVYITGYETTFDYLPVNNIGAIVATVNYALSVPFDQINGRPVDYINNHGGIDGVTNYQSGQTLIFAKQENFVNGGSYDGWVDYVDAYIGNDILTGVDQGYSSEAYDDYSIVPGYLESTQASTTITGNNTISSYTISQSIANAGAVNVYVNGILQSNSSYTISGTTLLFTTPPANVVVPSNPAQISVYSGVNLQSFTANGNVATFTLANIVSSPTTVLVNGTVITNANYTLANINGNTSITFTTTPPLITYPQIPPTILVTSLANSVNQRGGIWQIDIVNDVVNLIFVKPVVLNSKIQVAMGQTYNGSILIYTLDTTLGHTVPYYVPYKTNSTQLANSTQTTFNGGTTRFFSDRDQYYVPGSQDQYLKFPQYGAFP